MSRHLTICINSPSERTSEAIKVAEWLANQYKGHPNVESQHLSTMFLLLDLYTLFCLFHDKDYASALRVADRLQIIPMDPNNVQSFVTNFHMIPDQVCKDDFCLGSDF